MSRSHELDNATIQHPQEARGLAHYYWKVLKCSAEETWACFETSLRRVLIAILLYLATLGFTALAFSPDTAFRSEFPGLVIWLLAGFLLVVFLFVVNLIRAPHVLHNQVTTNLTVVISEKEAVDRERVALEDYIRNPRLALIFANEKPFFNIIPAGRSGDTIIYRSYFRVGVENISGSTIQNVKVQIEELEGFYNIPLRILNDNIPHRDEFVLNPGQHVMVQVAERLTNERGFRIITTHRHTALPSEFPLKEYVLLTVVASGHDAMPRRCSFRLTFSIEGHLVVEAIATQPQLTASSIPYTQGLLTPKA